MTHNDAATDQIIIFLTVFTIMVVAGNCYLLFTLNKRARQWITLTRDLISMLTKAEKEAMQFRDESRAITEAEKIVAAQLAVNKPPKAPPRKRSPKKKVTPADLTPGLDPQDRWLMHFEKPMDTP